MKGKEISKKNCSRTVANLFAVYNEFMKLKKKISLSHCYTSRSGYIKIWSNITILLKIRIPYNFCAFYSESRFLTKNEKWNQIFCFTWSNKSVRHLYFLFDVYLMNVFRRLILIIRFKWNRVISFKFQTNGLSCLNQKNLLWRYFI